MWVTLIGMSAMLCALQDELGIVSVPLKPFPSGCDALNRVQLCVALALVCRVMSPVQEWECSTNKNTT